METLVPIDTYHPALSLALEFNYCNQRVDPTWFYNFRRANYELMNIIHWKQIGLKCMSVRNKFRPRYFL